MRNFLLSAILILPANAFCLGISGAGVNSLSEMQDLGCADSEIIAWNATTSAWECSTAGAGHGNGANCAAGNAPLGVDASGAVEGCFDVGTQAEVNDKVSKAGDTMSGDLNMGNKHVLNVSSGSINGRLGIGNPAPSGKLHIGAVGNSTVLTGNEVTFDRNGDAYIDQIGSGDLVIRQSGYSTKARFPNAGGLTLSAGGPLNLSGPGGTITTQSSMTASSFYGDGANITNFTVSASTRVEGIVSIASLGGVHIATATLTLRGGGRPVLFLISGMIKNDSPGTRLYDASVTMDGTVISTISQIEVFKNNSEFSIGRHSFSISLPSGAHSFSVRLKSDDTGTPQNIRDLRLTVIEF